MKIKKVPKNKKKKSKRTSNPISLTDKKISNEVKFKRKLRSNVKATTNFTVTNNNVALLSRSEKNKTLSHRSKKSATSSSATTSKSDKIIINLTKSPDDENESDSHEESHSSEEEEEILIEEEKSEDNVTSDSSIEKLIKDDSTEDNVDNNDEMNTSLNYSLSDAEDDVVRFEQINSKEYLIFIKEKIKLYFHGKMNIEVISGCIKILGWEMCAGEKLPVFSPRGSSLICIENDSEEMCQIKVTPYSSHLTKCLNSLIDVQLFSGRKSLTDTQLPSSSIKVQAERALDSRFLYNNNKDNYRKKLTFNKDYIYLTDALLQNTLRIRNIKMVLCGGKNVGKSTFLRVLINRMLCQERENNTNNGLLILDFDPGQAEFTPPGMISAVHINKPLLGPNFTHQKTPAKMIHLGQIDVSKCSQEYQWGVKELIRYATEKYNHIPWIINTMGFTSGLGAALMRYISDSLGEDAFVIEIQSKNSNRNYPYEIFENKARNKYFHLYSAAEYSENEEQKQSHWGLPAKQLREIGLLSYLSPAIKEPEYSIIPTVPYTIQIKYLVLGILNDKVHPNNILRCLIGNVVGLCHAGTNAKAMCVQPNNKMGPLVLTRSLALPCYGYGIVTGVDLKEEQLYLQTPEPYSCLSKVNCLILGAVRLPYQLQIAGVKSTFCPYTASGSGQSTSAPTRRYFRPSLLKAQINYCAV